MSEIKELNPGEDAEARLAVISLMGQTMAHLKEIDKNIVGSSAYISGQKLNINSVLPPIQQAQQPAVQPQYVSQPVATTVAAGINIAPQSQTVQPVHNITPEEDPNQLVFDFNAKITPDTINNKLDRIIEKLESIVELQKKTLG